MNSVENKSSHVKDTKIKADNTNSGMKTLEFENTVKDLQNNKTFEFENTVKDLQDNKTFEINLADECGGEPEPNCFSSLKEFRYRVWEFCVRWKYIICC